MNWTELLHDLFTGVGIVFMFTAWLTLLLDAAEHFRPGTRLRRRERRIRRRHARRPAP